MRTKTHCKNEPLQLTSLPSKKKRQVRKKNLVNVRSPIMLHFVPLKLIPALILFLFLFLLPIECFWSTTQQFLASSTLAHDTPQRLGHFWQHDKNAKGNTMHPKQLVPPHGKTLAKPLCIPIKHSTEKHFSKRGSHAYTGTNKFLIAIKYLN